MSDDPRKYVRDGREDVEDERERSSDNYSNNYQYSNVHYPSREEVEYRQRHGPRTMVHKPYEGIAYCIVSDDGWYLTWSGRWVNDINDKDIIWDRNRDLVADYFEVSPSSIQEKRGKNPRVWGFSVNGGGLEDYEDDE